MKIGFIDYYLDEWHANNYPKWIEEASHGDVRVTHAFALIDSPKGGLTTDAWCEKFSVQKCETIEEIIDACDGLIVLSPDNAEKHLMLCEKPLQCGKPVYVDKTFAPDAETAKKIFDFAVPSKTPCYSTSALRYADEYKQIDTKKIRAINSWGPGTMEIYSIHQIEPVVMLMQRRAKRVMCLPGEKWATLAIEFEDGRCATISCFEQGGPFAMNLCMEGGNKEIHVESDYFHNFIVAMVDFFHNRKALVPHQETLDVMAVRGAGIQAYNQPFTWINI